MYRLGSERMNAKGYARVQNLARSTVNERLEFLERKHLVKHEDYGNWRITEKGIAFILATEGVSGVSVGVSAHVVSGQVSGVSDEVSGLRREEVSGKVSALGISSTHALKYSMEIKKLQITNQKLDSLKIRWKRLKITNTEQYILYFKECTIILTTKKAIVHIIDLVGVDLLDIEYVALERCALALEQIRKLGIDGDTIKYESGHYAQVNSMLADLLTKVDQRFKVDLEDGKWFWVDWSTGVPEDETNDRHTRMKLQEFIKWISKTDFPFTDLDKLRELIILMLKYQAMTLKDKGDIHEP